VMCRFSS